MNGPWTIEMLARNGEVLHRYRVAALPIRVGRAYDNDFIVDDDYAAPHHVVIQESPDGKLLLRDLGSRNGIVHKGRRVTELALDGDTVVRMGHTTLRVRGADYPVGPELRDRTMHGWEGLLPGAAGALLTGLVALLAAWLTDRGSYELERYVQALAAGIGIGLLWSGLWAFNNRVFSRHARLGRHLFIFGCGLATLLAFRLLASLLAYAYSWEWLTRYGSHAAVLTVAGVIYFHLATVKPQLRTRLRAICAGMAILASGLVLVGNEQRHGRVADELYMSVLLPPELRASPDAPVAEFIGQVGAMRAEIDAERRRKPGDEG
ncbi:MULTISPECIES: FHA domain-containing protein [unclassified Massilia]|uniref:FHA domain-containing protein n=1 Tax=unclassified Massilia TaxID=2609279 RepID=UPI001B832B57|nr:MULTISPECIES: FHA domain-containing protein [unclassified Massilia]MBQ5939038.1 FHA domain-containing protein [Massilia sp. AB1]MBQ5962411.1 FHA domain-containing protein [Massilia sp. ZL223]